MFQEEQIEIEKAGMGKPTINMSSDYMVRNDFNQRTAKFLDRKEKAHKVIDNEFSFQPQITKMAQ